MICFTMKGMKIMKRWDSWDRVVAEDRWMDGAFCGSEGTRGATFPTQLVGLVAPRQPTLLTGDARPTGSVR